MRRTLAMALVLMSLAAVAGAQTRGDTKVTLYASNVQYGWSEGNGSFGRAGYALGLAYFLTPRWSAEVSYGSEPQTLTRTFFFDGGNVILFDTYRVNSHPLDVIGRYHIATNNRWKPYVGLGGRWTDRPDGFVDSRVMSALSAQAIVGTAFEITPRLSIQLDGKQLLRSDPAPWDDGTKFSAGIGWKF